MWIQDITKARSFSGRLESPCETRGGFIRSILCASAAGGSERVGAGGVRVSAVGQRSAECCWSTSPLSLPDSVSDFSC